MWEPELLGLFSAIGIQKGEAFAPDERMRTILTEAVAIGNATARAIYLRPRMEHAYIYPESAWYTGVVGGDYEFVKDEGRGGRYLDSRTLMFYGATLNTPAMVMKMVGVGSQYAYACTDRNGDYLDGGRTYKLRIPADVPARNFWSVVVYDPQTRSELQTGQTFPSENNRRDRLTQNPDGSIDLHFGPVRPASEDASRTGSRPCPARAGSSSCGSTVRSSRGSTRRGGQASSNRSTDPVRDLRAQLAGTAQRTSRGTTMRLCERSRGCGTLHGMRRRSLGAVRAPLSALMSLRGAAARPSGRRLMLVAAVVGLVFASVSVAGAGPAAKRASAKRVVTVYSVATGLQYINSADDSARGKVNNPLDSSANKLAPRSSAKGDGPFAGDIAIYSVGLYSNPTLKQHAGSGVYTCYFNYDQHALCQAYYKLKAGGSTLVASGPVDFKTTGFTIVITGGTNSYLGARGRSPSPRRRTARSPRRRAPRRSTSR